MKWWVWFVIGAFVFIVTALIGRSMWQRERSKADSLAKARAAKAEYAAANNGQDTVTTEQPAA